jgi:hypothetical protein
MGGSGAGPVQLIIDLKMGGQKTSESEHCDNQIDNK